MLSVSRSSLSGTCCPAPNQEGIFSIFSFRLAKSAQAIWSMDSNSMNHHHQSVHECLLLLHIMHVNLTRYPLFLNQLEIVNNLITCLYAQIPNNNANTSCELTNQSLVSLLSETLDLLYRIMTLSDDGTISLDVDRVSKLLTSLVRITKSLDHEFEKYPKVIHIAKILLSLF
jgi:hypothetical protein